MSKWIEWNGGECPVNRLREVISYDESNGMFYWNSNKKYRPSAKGEIAGYIDKSTGYRRITVGNKKFYAHHLAWALKTGDFPELFIDHIDGDRQNNKFSNLRLVSRSGNNRNRRASRSDSETNVLGVGFDKRRVKFYARIFVKPKNYFLGYFNSSEDARNAYIKAKRILHETCSI